MALISAADDDDVDDYLTVTYNMKSRCWYLVLGTLSMSRLYFHMVVNFAFHRLKVDKYQLGTEEGVELIAYLFLLKAIVDLVSKIEIIILCDFFP